MLYRCLSCEEEIEFGWLPPATCGLFFFYPLATGVGYALLITFYLWGWLGDWALLAALPLAVVCVFVLGWIPSAVEYLRVRRHPCPKCGRKHWSRGYISGFGL
jgi:hypothetical protein